MNSMWILILLPAATGLTAFFIHKDSIRRILWVCTALVHFVLTLLVITNTLQPILNTWIGLDALSTIFITLTSILFLGITAYGIQYVSRERIEPVMNQDGDDERLSRHVPEAIFTGCILLFFSSMSLVILSRHIALQWVAIEATTLTSTPLIYYHRHRRSLEAAWKYLIICSVAIALSLLGVFFIKVSIPHSIEGFTIDILVPQAHQLNTKLLEIAFIFFLVGYGAKMGLAPMHTWLPDAHSEAPAPVSALLSGALLNCSFIGILRLQELCVAAGTGSFGRQLLVIFGLLSMGLAGIFMLHALDYKRLLAYSSIEHMGILALGVGIGGTGVFGSFLHAINHSLVKVLLFLTAGNIQAAFHTKKITDIKGLLHSMPVTGLLWFAGFLSITGSPPFGTFLSEFLILNAIVVQGRWIVSGMYLLFLSMACIGMLRPFIQMSFGKPERTVSEEPILSVVPQAIFIMLSFLLCFYIPRFLTDILDKASILFDGGIF